MVDWLKGKKSYITAWLMIIIGLLQAITGELTWAEFFNSESLILVLNGFGLGFLRAGVAKNGNK